MKSAIELVKELRKEEAGSYINASRSAGIGYATAKLEAWLRQADKSLESFSNDIGELYVARIRQKLLGTTRPISKNGE